MRAARATASRTVPGFDETSTIRASPRASTWLSRGASFFSGFSLFTATGSDLTRGPGEGECSHLHGRDRHHRGPDDPAGDAERLHRREDGGETIPEPKLGHRASHLSPFDQERTISGHPRQD